MYPDPSLKGKLMRLLQKLRSDKRRFLGILLIVLGLALGAASRAAGGNPLQDFIAGLRMGFSVGVLLVGLLVTLLSYTKNKGEKS